MNTWIIAAIVIGLLVVGVIAVNGFVAAQQNAKTTSGCGTCSGKCTADSNCGKEGCTAAKTGTCNCGK